MSRKYYYTPFLNSDANERETWNKYRQKGYLFLRTESAIPVRKETTKSKSLNAEGGKRGVGGLTDPEPKNAQALEAAAGDETVHYIDPEDLAHHLVQRDGLQNIKVNIRLLVCWGGGATRLDAEFDEWSKSSIAARVARAIQLELRVGQALPVVGGYLGPTETKTVGKRVQVNPWGREGVKAADRGQRRFPAKAENWTEAEEQSPYAQHVKMLMDEEGALVRWFDGNGTRTSKHAPAADATVRQPPAKFDGLGAGDTIVVMAHGDLLTGRILPFAGAVSERMVGHLVNKIGRSEEGKVAATGKSKPWMAAT